MIVASWSHYCCVKPHFFPLVALSSVPSYGSFWWQVMYLILFAAWHVLPFVPIGILSTIKIYVFSLWFHHYIVETQLNGAVLFIVLHMHCCCPVDINLCCLTIFLGLIPLSFCFTASAQHFTIVWMEEENGLFFVSKNPMFMWIVAFWLLLCCIQIGFFLWFVLCSVSCLEFVTM